MKRIELKDCIIEVTDADEKYLDNIMEIVGKKSYKDITMDEFKRAILIDKLFSGETIKLENGRTIRMSTENGPKK